MTQPVLRLAQIWQDFHQARLSIDRLGDILNTHPETAPVPTRSALPAIRGNIEFDHVFFRYRPDGPEILHDISVQDLHGHLHVEQHVELDERLTLKTAHDQVTELEADMRRDVPEIAALGNDPRGR